MRAHINHRLALLLIIGSAILSLRAKDQRAELLMLSFSQSGDEDAEDRKGRKKLRKILKNDKLRSETRDALKEEEDRRKRIAEREALREKLREVKMNSLD